MIATQKLADRARDQADAMDKLRKAGEAQAKATGDLKDITQKQADKIAGLYGAIQSSAKASADAADATRRQADATQAEARSVAGQTEAVNKSLIATQDMAAATRRGAAASEQANDISARAFAASERPWVGVSGLQAGQPQAGQDFKITLTVQNTGRSPSLNTRAYFNAGLADATKATLPTLVECLAGCSSSTVLPNGTTGYVPTVDKTLLTPEEIKRLSDGKDTILLTGRIDYVDDAGNKHITAFCNFWNNKSATFSSCTIGNTAN